MLACSVIAQGQDEDKPLRITDIRITGNDVTHPSIIFREMEVYTDSVYTQADFELLVQNSIRNLQRTRLFNFVEIEQDSGASYNENIVLLVKLTERWYIWPLPVFELADPNFNLWWKERDFNRVNVGLNVDHHNFRGRAERLSLRFKWGYNKQIGLAYTKPYINRAKTLGISLSTRYQQRFEITYATVNNDRELYAKLGNNTREEVLNKIDLIYRPGNRFSTYITLWQNNTSVGDTVLILAPEFFGDREGLNFMGVGVYMSYDSRDLPSYPLRGMFASLSVNRPGIGLKEAYPFDIWATEASLNIYRPLSGSVFLGSRVKAGMLSYQELPYFFQSGFGFTGDLRGYELYFVDAQRYIASQNHIKFALVKQREFKLPFIKNPSFGRVPYGLYLSAHADIAYSEDDVYTYRNPLDREFLLGYGLGLDFVTYYDKVLRVEYSLNGFGESGVYLHFKKAF